MNIIGVQPLMVAIRAWLSPIYGRPLFWPSGNAAIATPEDRAVPVLH